MPTDVPSRPGLPAGIIIEESSLNSTVVLPSLSFVIRLTVIDWPGAPVSPFSPLSPFGPATPWAPLSPFGPATPCAPVSPLSPLSPFAPLGILIVVPSLNCTIVFPFGSTVVLVIVIDFPAGPCAPVSPLSPFGPAGPLAPVAP